ncbi:hypothetical protein QM467_03325 [Rhodoblastus sp. 17X3]|uniref:hypothetical protein n=1 Tax=Rhodoblastus sp. 17X3 TaxID=3047026 RepID=UPI0024B6890C|nr:hypothetical protein [Rhodoblastus sp. 17X3]MDI9847090.1 hypothetical protein [Rhodoblastus sp. 17X3]
MAAIHAVSSTITAIGSGVGDDAAIVDFGIYFRDAPLPRTSAVGGAEAAGKMERVEGTRSQRDKASQLQ